MEEWTILEMQARMQSGEINSQRLANQYLDRIETLDRSGPMLNSIIEMNPDALAISEQLDKERAEGQVRGLLHGIPIIIKDKIDTADRMTTTDGSLALEGSIAVQVAFFVSRLREAGVVILGKANLSEWANFRSTHSISSWSSRGGQTRNPYALDRNPCGSSSGSAVAVGANLCSVAIGTETDGSIICPSQTNGIVGIKPTLGLVSRSGVIPVAHSQDTAGPMARTVTDAAILLGAMTGIDPRDPATFASQAHTDYTQFLKKEGLTGVRIGVARNFFGTHPLVDKIIENCLEAIKALGAELVDPANHRLSRDERIESTLKKYNLDAIVAPSGNPAWLVDYVNGDCGSGGSSSPAAVVGYPNITVPAGFVFGLPVGISFFGKAFSEPLLIRLAFAFEQSVQARRPPQFLPTVNLSQLQKQ